MQYLKFIFILLTVLIFGTGEIIAQETKQGLPAPVIEESSQGAPTEFKLSEYLPQAKIEALKINHPKRYQAYVDFEKEYKTLSKKVKQTWSVDHLVKLYIRNKTYYQDLIKSAEE